MIPYAQLTPNSKASRRKNHKKAQFMKVRKPRLSDGIYTIVVVLIITALGKGVVANVNSHDLRFIKPVIAEEIQVTPQATASATPKPTPEPTETPHPYTAEGQHQFIVDEINRVFTVHAPQAFKLLTCENGRLDPNITNTNKDGSTDWGVFQINDHWNGFNKPVNNDRFLTDWRINIAIAWRIYESSGFSFDRWACAKKVGLQ